MASQNKKNKEKNAWTHHGQGLKNKTLTMKRRLYFTPAMRKQNNKKP